ncbi:MAG: ISL3 family transposase [Planctomycetes bacterium]|nr:ISL3 family transposase [Planctomycetota bacterium]
MSTSLLYQAFGLRGYEHEATRFKRGKVILQVAHVDKDLRCSVCGSYAVVCRGRVPRVFRTVPIGRKETWISLQVQRVFCYRCESIRQVSLGFAEPKVRYTRAFERYALDLSRRMTILDVAQHLGVSWDTIKDIQKRYLKKRFTRPRLKGIKEIAIDEISIGRGHRYLTVVLDLLTGAVLFVGDGKGAAALGPFWRSLRSSGARVRAVAMDMSPAFIEAVSRELPRAKIVFDHFHVVKLFNDKLSDLRRDIYREVTDKMQKKALKGTRWILLKNPENLQPKHNEKQRLEEALRINKPLATAYYMREDLRCLWLLCSKAAAARFLTDWCARAEASGVKMLIKFAHTLRTHRTGLLAYYDHPISTGPLEGTNTKIRVMQRQAYGFRDTEFFKLKIMALHLTKYALVG